MPEAAVNENSDLLFRKSHVCATTRAWNRDLGADTNAKLPKSVAKGEFGRCVASPSRLHSLAHGE
jgi:hypothetical protein